MDPRQLLVFVKQACRRRLDVPLEAGLGSVAVPWFVHDYTSYVIACRALLQRTERVQGMIVVVGGVVAEV